MKQKIKIWCLPDGTAFRATFDTINQAEGPDHGRRVKHRIYQDREDPRLWWHERIWLSNCRYVGANYFTFVSKRKFFKKVRLVMHRDGCLAETWQMVADCISVIEKSNGISNTVQWKR